MLSAANGIMLTKRGTHGTLKRTYIYKHISLPYRHQYVETEGGKRWLTDTTLSFDYQDVGTNPSFQKEVHQ